MKSQEDKIKIAAIGIAVVAVILGTILTMKRPEASNEGQPSSEQENNNGDPLASDEYTYAGVSSKNIFEFFKWYSEHGESEEQQKLKTSISKVNGQSEQDMHNWVNSHLEWDAQKIENSEKTDYEIELENLYHLYVLTTNSSYIPDVMSEEDFFGEQSLALIKDYISTLTDEPSETEGDEILEIVSENLSDEPNGDNTDLPSETPDEYSIPINEMDEDGNANAAPINGDPFAKADSEIDGASFETAKDTYTVETESGPQAVNDVLENSKIYNRGSGKESSWKPEDLSKFADKNELFDHLYHYEGACQFAKDVKINEIEYHEDEITHVHAYLTIKDGVVNVHRVETDQLLLLDDGIWNEDMLHITWGW